MKATGITRRIDDLGRVVIPKEIRRTLGFREGDPIEFFVEGRKLVLNKYSQISQYAEQAYEYVHSFQNVAGCYVMVTDTERIIATTLHGFYNTPLSKEIIEAVRNKQDVEGILLGVDEKSPVVEYAAIIRDGSCDGTGEGIGAIVLLQDTSSSMNEMLRTQMRIAADFLGRLANTDGRPGNV